MKVRTFNSTREMLEWTKDAQARAGEHTREWQEAIAPGDHFAIFDSRSGFIIYGEALQEDDETSSASGTLLFARCFSVVVPDGEYGFIHVVQLAGLLSAKQFEEARSLGWPNDVEGFSRVVADDPQWRADPTQ